MVEKILSKIPTKTIINFLEKHGYVVSRRPSPTILKLISKDFAA